MRNIAEIRKDLSAQVELIKGMDKKADEAAYDAAVEKWVEEANIKVDTNALKD